MRNVLIFLACVLGIACSSYCHGQQNNGTWGNGFRYGPNYGLYQPRVYYIPQTTWIPDGVNLNVNGVYYNRQTNTVTMGLNFNLYRFQGVQNFHFYDNRRYRRYR